MSQNPVEKDIYDKNGVLLLAKGQKTTNAILAKLQRHGYYEPEAPARSEAKGPTELFSIAPTLGERMGIRNNHVLEHANEILSAIIFESKTKPWWNFVNALSNYVDWLYTHSIDVAMISLMMAIELGYSDQELQNIGLGSFLHDVGKLLIPRSILEKPGPLDAMETTYIRQHCELGVSSLQPCGVPKACTDIVLQHHERLRGVGYPKGMKGDEICRDAKIVMIADAFDAITSGRPYRSTRGSAVAIRILRNDDGNYSYELISVLEKILV